MCLSVPQVPTHFTSVFATIILYEILIYPFSNLTVRYHTQRTSKDCPKEQIAAHIGSFHVYVDYKVKVMVSQRGRRTATFFFVPHGSSILEQGTEY
jgi:hypothetical protein